MPGAKLNRKDKRPLAPPKVSRTKRSSPAAKSANKRPAAAKKPAAKTVAKLASKLASKSANKLANQTAHKPGPKQAAKEAEQPSGSRETLRLVLARLEDMKAENSVTIDLSDKPSIGQYMIVTTGRSNVHVGAIADSVVRGLKGAGKSGLHVEGLRQGDWVLIDAGDVIVHVFRPEVREFYNLEKMWSA